MKTIRKTWKMLGENIYIGERYERNMKSIAVLSVIMAVAGLVMLIVNLASREYSVAMTSVPFMVTGGVTWYFTGMDPARADRYALLRRAGIDPEQGLIYCREDEDLYLTLLGEFAASAGEKQQEMQAFLDAGDWENYGILVHSLKSAAATIGAPALSAKAAALEKAAKETQADVIRLNHPDLLESYLPAAEAAALVAGPAEQIVLPENGILEFPPEE